MVNGRPRGFGSDPPKRVGPGSGVATHGLGKCEGVDEDSRHGIGHVDIRVCS